MSDILDVLAGLVEIVKQENNRSTPLSHVGKSPLYFVLLNKFGVTALVILFMRCEYLFSSDDITEDQQNDWLKFLNAWSKHTDAVGRLAVPLEAIPAQIFSKHVNRFSNFGDDKKALLTKYFVDVHIVN